MKVETDLSLLKNEIQFTSFGFDDIQQEKQENINFTNFFESQEFEIPDLDGGNNSDCPFLYKLHDRNYLIPPNCRFYNKDVRYLSHYLDTTKFDFILIDPPWSNRFIKRTKASIKSSYSTLDHEDIASIPLENHIKTESLVVVWCTNSDTHISELKTRFIPKWNLKLIANWYWVKIDKSGDLICPFADKGNKQPFEQIFICTNKDYEAIEGKIKKQDLIFSIPSTIHSHKPFLLPIFSQFLPENPKCLELFARSLYENFTSFGTEVIKLQNILLFDEIKY